MIKKYFACLVALLTITAAGEVIKQFEPLKAKVTVKVLDEAGHPFPNVDVQIGLEDPKTRLMVYAKGKTDAGGLFTGEGNCDGSVAGGVHKEGYYWSGFPFKITGESEGKWLPWNPIYETVLRPIGKTVALYVKKVQTDIPVLGKPCGYDLETGDWVAPYGKGMKSDLVFTIISRSVTNNQNFDMRCELTFANHLDGLQAAPELKIGENSVFKWERQAPENGYQARYHIYYTWWENLHQKPVQNFKFDGKESEGYYFRVRTVDQDGKVVSAHYGKIRGGIEVSPRWSSTCSVAFIYYYNPTSNDRNLEWDTKKNLFTGLSFMETPREP